MEHDARQLQQVCVSCGAPLLARYRMDGPGPSLAEVLARPAGAQRLQELSPVTAPRTLGEGATALLPAHRLAERLDLPGLLVKDEARNPTGSYKARGMAFAIARAAELGVRAVCLPTAGNAGGAAAAYGALYGMEVHVYLPDATPRPILAEIEAHGARVTRVPGTIADAAAALAKDSAGKGWLALATLREPYRLEGKKVMGFELLYDLGRLPDAIVYPTGGGTGLVGMWKAFDEMEALGWIGRERPAMISVQSAGCAPLVRAFAAGMEEMPAWEAPEPTAAHGLRVPGAIGGFLMLRALRESGGTAIAVSEGEIADGTTMLARDLGLHGSAEGGACIAAVGKLRRDGTLGRDQQVVVFNTGSALKYVE
jgi:threonine synthase